MPSKGFLTQCDSGGRLVCLSRWSPPPVPPVCENMIRLEKPAPWRCEKCSNKYGPLPKK